MFIPAGIKLNSAQIELNSDPAFSPLAQPHFPVMDGVLFRQARENIRGFLVFVFSPFWKPLKTRLVSAENRHFSGKTHFF